MAKAPFIPPRPAARAGHPAPYRRKKPARSPGGTFATLVTLAFVAGLAWMTRGVWRPLLSRAASSAPQTVETKAPQPSAASLPAPAPPPPSTIGAGSARPSAGGALAVPPLNSMLAEARARFNAARTERQVEDTSEAILSAMASRRDLSPGQRSDFRAAVEQLEAAAWKRVELPGVELTSAFLRRGVIPSTGRAYQEVAITFKNTGTAPVSEVWGRYLVADESGEVIEGRDQLCFFAAETPADRIPPGGSYTVPESKGRWLVTDKPAAQCAVAIEKVVHD